MKVSTTPQDYVFFVGGGGAVVGSGQRSMHACIGSLSHMYTPPEMLICMQSGAIKTQMW